MKYQKYLLYFAISSISNGFLLSTPTQAQITTDNSLPVPTEIIKQSERLTEIMGGTEAGINLFHSFAEFSVEEGNIARFINNNSDIQNIIGRVTGTSVSEIFGQIEASGIAPNFNLFLLNPNGIIFGSDASLNINGSFVATTANAIQFGDRGWFATANPNDPSLLIIQPSAFFFNQIGANSIQNQSRHQIETRGEEALILGLQVPQEKSLLLLGGNVTMNGGIITASNGRVALGGLSEKGTVALNAENKNLSLSFPDNVARSNVLLTNGAKIDVSDRGSGSIAINAQNIEISKFSELASGILENLESGNNEAGKITLQATQKIAIDDSQIGSLVDEGAIGNSGDISIRASSLNLFNGAFIFTRIGGLGNAGNISIDVSNEIIFEGLNSDFFSSDIINQILPSGEGQGGNITIDAKSLSLSDGASIQTGTRGKGDGGNIIIRVDDFVSLKDTNDQTTQIRSVVEPGGVGNGGTIDIQARSLSLTQGSQLAASVFRTFDDLPGGKGTGGDIIINTSDSVNISGVGVEGFSSGIFTNTQAEAEGMAGDISINTSSLRLADGAVINSQTNNSSNGGNIKINANTFEVIGGGQLIANADNSGDAGSITVNARDFVIISGSDPTFSARFAEFGSSVVSNLDAKSGFFVSSESTGQAGNITVNTPQLTLDEGRIDAETAQTSGETGANINLESDLLIMQNESLISATASDLANGGNINIDANFVVAFPNQNNDIIARAERGTGGNIDITTNGLFGISERSSTPANNTNDIDPSSEFGLDGTVNINELEVNPAEGLENLPTEVIDVARLVTQNLCQQGRGSEFVVTGKGGVAASPSEARDGDLSAVNLVEPVLASEAGEQGSSDGSPRRRKTQRNVHQDRGVGEAEKEIIEAQGWIVSDRGTIELVAHATEPNNLPPQFNNQQICPTP